MGFTMYFDDNANEYIIQLGIGKKLWRFANKADAWYYFIQWTGHEPIYDAICDGWH